MRQIAYLLLPILLSPLVAAEAKAQEIECPPPTASDAEFATFAKGILRKVELSRFTSSPSKFCREAMGMRYLKTTKIKNSEVDAAYAEGTLGSMLEKQAEDDIDYFRKAAAKDRSNIDTNKKWTLSLLPSERAKQAAASIIEIDAVYVPDGDKFGKFDSENYIKKASLKFALGLLDKEECKELYPSERSVPPAPKRDAAELGITEVAMAKTAACAEMLGILRATECSKPFDVVARLAQPSSTANLLASELFKKVEQDGRYDKGLVIAAKKLSARFSGGKLEGDFFSDLKASFLQAGASESDASNMAWNSIGLISSAGPNLESRLSVAFDPKLPSTRKKISLAILASVLPALDHKASSEGNLYSWPPGVKGSCDTSKSYHFWYSAFLARQSALESGNAEASAAAAYQAAKLYHVGFRPKTTGRGKLPAPDLYSETAAVVRADLSYAAGGAIFGANAAGNRKAELNIDSGIKRLIESGGDGTSSLATMLKNFSSKAEDYERWNAQFNPNEAFAHFAKNGFPTGKIENSAAAFDAAATPMQKCN